MKIIELQAENVKRLKAIQIKPNGDVVEISGRNGAGKSSTLDAIWWALAGKDVIQSQPIRKGETEARIFLDLGEMKITRTFEKVGDAEFTTSVRVETVEGAKFGSPQKVLDALVGELSFDPLEFSRLDTKGQFEALKRLVPGIDFDEIEEANKRDFDERRDVNRSAKEARNAASSISIPADAPEELIDVSALSAELAEAGEKNTEIERRKARREQVARDIASNSGHIKVLRDNILSIQKQITELEDKNQELKARLDGAEPPPDPIDTSEIQQKIAGAELTNNLVRMRAERAAYERRAATLEEKSKALTGAIDDRNAAKAKAIADAKLPVEGLTLEDGGVFLNGIPFDQASDAEQLRASMAIAMAMNPRLRILRVRDGSLLDDASMAIIAEMAGERDFQVWIETVQSGRAGAVVIEDGQVAGSKSEAA